MKVKMTNTSPICMEVKMIDNFNLHESQNDRENPNFRHKIHLHGSQNDRQL